MATLTPSACQHPPLPFVCRCSLRSQGIAVTGHPCHGTQGGSPSASLSPGHFPSSAVFVAVGSFLNSQHLCVRHVTPLCAKVGLSKGEVRDSSYVHRGLLLFYFQYFILTVTPFARRNTLRFAPNRRGLFAQDEAHVRAHYCWLLDLTRNTHPDTSLLRQCLLLLDRF